MKYLIALSFFLLVGCSMNNKLVPSEIELETNVGQQMQSGTSTAHYEGVALHFHWSGWKRE